MKALNYSRNYFSKKNDSVNEKDKTIHKGEWLTIEVAKRYRDVAEKISANDMQSIGERRRLRLELEEKYGVTEIEAINILNGFSIGDYVDKYYRMRNRIDLKKNNKKSRKGDDDDNDETIMAK